MNALNSFLFIALPYIAIVLCVVGCIYRYRSNGFKVSSLSSQFMNSDSLFFGSTLFHWSMLVIFLGHLFVFFFPGLVLALNSNPTNLVIHEGVGFMFGLGALIGLIWLFIRRLSNDRVNVVTTRMDIFIELLIITQIVLGCWIAIFLRWGSSWFASNLTPYLWSIVKLNPEVMEFKLNRIDPIKRQTIVKEEEIGEGLSPMEPPDAYAPPSMEPVSSEEMHPILRQFVNEHDSFLKEVNAFEDTLLSIQKNGYTREADGKLKHFFNFFDEEFISHNRREEATVFPLLRKRLIASGEHGVGDDPSTAIDMMEDEHTKAAQLAAVILNFLGLAFRFPDERSKLIVLDAALEQSKFLVELLRLHVFREDNVVFPLAHRLITQTEFDAM